MTTPETSTSIQPTQPAHHPIHPNTTLGPVSLTVAQLDRSLAFYQERLGFQVHQLTDNMARLGAGGPDILVLTEQPGARHVRGTTGLYHFAVLVPSRLELARTLRRLAETRTPLQGFADHLVSEAIYLADPDGNGIEIYRDRPRAEWVYEPNQQIRMASDPLDIEGILDELNGHDEPWSGLAAGTKLGHMHLHVAHLDDTKHFYVDILGFDLMARFGPSALFVSAGGYHHHIGLNTWAGVGAPPPPADAAGLRDFVVLLPNQAELERVLERVRGAGIATEETPAGILVRDPSRNGIVLAAKEVTKE
jgi:catechol 2,3-dioxygenase